MREWFDDLRYGTRMVAKRPGTSAIAVIALALGIGLTTTMFSIVEGVLLRGLPFDRAERLLALDRGSVQEPERRRPVPLHDLADWRHEQRSFEALAGYDTLSVRAAGDGGFPERFRAARITTNLLAVLRVAPILGRDFGPADAAAGAPAVMLIGHRVWTSRYRADPAVLGQTLRIEGVPTTIVGVLPEKFGFPESQEVWLPFDETLPAVRGQGQSLSVLGRLNDGVTLEAARSEMAGIARQLAEAHVENKDATARVRPFAESAVPARVRTTFYAMLIAVLGVMLIACVNVTNLQLARAAERAKEFAIRTALGSGRWRIVRQSLAEGLVLSVAGALIGLGIAQFGVSYFMRAIADTQPPFWIDVRLDTVVLAFATAITVAAALVSSLVPGLRVARTDANAVLKDDTRGATSLRMGHFGRWLVIVEVAVSCVLLVVSGLMVRSILMTSRIDFPFETRQVFFGQVFFDQATAAGPPELTRLIEGLLARLERLPGARRVALANSAPGVSASASFAVDGVAYATPEEQPQALRMVVGPGFFDVLDVTARSGRLFTAADTASAMPVALVDEAFAARYLPGGSPIGRRLRVGNATAPWVTVVGLLPTLARPPDPTRMVEAMYVPLAQNPVRGLTILARTAGDPRALTADVRAAVVDVSADTPVTGVNTLAGEFWRRGWANRLFGGLFLTFGVAALMLAAAGLYGVMSFTVRRRTQEIGVRMALGASRRGVLGMVLWQGLWRVALGIALGLWPGWFLATQLGALLSNFSATDPVVHGITALTLLIAGGLATLAPALRASSVDPLTALRRD